MTKNINQPIALTWHYRNRLEIVRNAGVSSKHFKPDSIDIPKTFSTFQNNKEIVDNNDNRGFMRLGKQPKYRDKQSKDLQKKINLCKGLNCRYLVRLPDEFPDYNSLREIFREIQEDAGMKRVFIFTGNKETFETIDNYWDTLPENKDYVLVMDMAMEYETFRQLLSKYIKICSEIVLLYREWTGFKKNFKLAITTATTNQDKLHMAFVPVDLNNFGNKEIVSSVLIASGFKSVSLADTEFKHYIKVKKGGRARTITEKLDFARWVNEILMNYDKKHRKECKCCSSDDAEGLAKKHGIKEIQTQHNLEVLSKEYILVKTDTRAQERMIELDAVRTILNALEVS